MYACMCVCFYVVYVMHERKYVCMYVRNVYVCMCACLYVCRRVVCVSMHALYVCMYVCMDACTYVCNVIHMHVSMHVL